jgi:hypothetical protein
MQSLNCHQRAINIRHAYYDNIRIIKEHPHDLQKQLESRESYVKQLLLFLSEKCPNDLIKDICNENALTAVRDATLYESNFNPVSD